MICTFFTLFANFSVFFKLVIIIPNPILAGRKYLTQLNY